MIKLKNVSRGYPARAEAEGGVIRALDNFSLDVALASGSRSWDRRGQASLLW